MEMPRYDTDTDNPGLAYAAIWKRHVSAVQAFSGELASAYRDEAALLRRIGADPDYRQEHYLSTAFGPMHRAGFDDLGKKALLVIDRLAGLAERRFVPEGADFFRIDRDAYATRFVYVESSL